MNKFLTGLVAVAALSLVSQSALATDVAVVNVASILQDSQQVKDATQKIKEQFSPQQKEIQDLQAGLADQAAAMQKDEAVMSDEDKAKAAEKMAKDRQDVIQKIAAFQQALNDAQTATMKTIFDALNATISDVAKAGEYDMVIDSQFVVFNDKGDDITDKVQKAFSQ
jgi:outer membrane protein